MRQIAIAVLCLATLIVTGCAQHMVGREPRTLDRSVLVGGTQRELVVGCLGQPLTHDEVADGTLTETFRVNDGGACNTRGRRIGRIALYTVCDLCTVWLAQFATMPYEAKHCHGQKSTIIAHYERRSASDSQWVLARIEEHVNETP